MAANGPSTNGPSTNGPSTRQQSPRRGTNARKKTPSSSEAEKHHIKIICDNVKSADMCAADCRSPHQTSVPVSCGYSPQLVSHVYFVYCLGEYARNSQGLTPPRTQNNTKHNTQHPTPTNAKPPAVLVMPHMTKHCVNSCRHVQVRTGFQRPPNLFELYSYSQPGVAAITRHCATSSPGHYPTPLKPTPPPRR